MLIDGLESCELLVDCCDFLIICLDSHSDGTHSLQRIHWWASDVMLNFSKSVSDEETNLRVSTFSENFHFWVNYLFNTIHKASREGNYLSNNYNIITYKSILEISIYKTTYVSIL